MMNTFPSNNKHGQAVIMVIFAMMIFGALGMVLTSLVGNDLDIAQRNSEAETAFYCAESGLRVMLNYLNEVNPNYRTATPPERSLGVGTFAVSVIDHPSMPGGIIVTSTGFVPNATDPRAQRVLEQTVTIASGATSPIYSYTLFTAGNVAGGGYLIFDGNQYTINTRSAEGGIDDQVHTNQSMIFRNGRRRIINGTASVEAGNTIQVINWRQGSPYRYQDPNGPHIAPPVLDTASKAFYRQKAQAQGRYVTGDIIINGTQDLFYYPTGPSGEGVPGILFAEGTVTISAGSDLRYANIGTIVAGGDIVVRNDVRAAQRNDCNLALIAYGDILLTMTGAHRIDAVMYANDEVRIPQQCRLSVYGNCTAQNGLVITPQNPLSLLYLYLKTDVFREGIWDTVTFPSSGGDTSYGTLREIE